LKGCPARLYAGGSRTELIEFTGMSRYYTMSAIIKPPVESGRLPLTIPEKPKSKHQRYMKDSRL